MDALDVLTGFPNKTNINILTNHIFWIQKKNILKYHTGHQSQYNIFHRWGKKKSGKYCRDAEVCYSAKGSGTYNK